MSKFLGWICVTLKASHSKFSYYFPCLRRGGPLECVPDTQSIRMGIRHIGELNRTVFDGACNDLGLLAKSRAVSKLTTKPLAVYRL